MTTFQNSLRVGTVKDGYTTLNSGTTSLAGAPNGCNLGNVQLCQQGTISFKAATLVNDLTFFLPPNSTIQNILIDTLTAYDSATSAGLTVGTATGGTQYVSGPIDVKTTGRETQSLSAAQLLAMSNIGTNTSVVATVTSVGQPTTGTVFVQILYTVN